MVKNRLTAIIALGANVSMRDNPLKVTLEQAIQAIADAGLVIRSQSRLFSTPCFPAGAGPDYVNAAVQVETDLSPNEVLSILNNIEHDFGRTRVQRWGMRTLDLDLICLGDQVMPDLQEYERWRTLPADQQAKIAPDTLVLPHPRLQDRAFVLVPMAEIVPQWRHPVLDRTVAEMLDQLPADEIALVRAL